MALGRPTYKKEARSAMDTTNIAESVLQKGIFVEQEWRCALLLFPRVGLQIATTENHNINI